ncbi:MAG: phasin family protein [Steroidobacteraceae bacterium]|jgi:poly(hydroxyalkanoate) granule-associated protein|nr:phasin family protein [Steroidobacteraceae bacterium]
MIENVNTFISGLKTSEVGKATRRSANVIFKANLEAWNTTREELGKVVGIVVKEGEKLTRKSRMNAEDMVGNVAEVATDRVQTVEKAFQKRVNKVIHEIGLPTAAEVDRLSRRVELLSKKVEARTAARAKRRTPAKRATRRAA